MIEPWKKTAEELIFDGYRKVVSRKFINYQGKEVEFHIRKGNKSTCTLALTTDNQVILAKQFRPGPELVMIELPGGVIEKGEDPAVAASRELLEETGYAGEMKFVKEGFFDAYSTGRRHHFVATNCKKIADPITTPEEQTEVILMPLTEFRNHLRKGELSDTTTGYLGLDFLNLL